METAKCTACGARVGVLDPRTGFERLCATCLLTGVIADLAGASGPAKGVLSGRTLGNYEVLGLIGSGGMGAVYRARQRGLDREVALKVLAAAGGEQEAERFLREARALARLRHPNIVAVHEVASDGGFTFYTMDFVPGYTLADEIARGPMAPRRAAEIVRTIALAVQHAHERGIIHRDIKPGNILLGERGDPMVADFGIARDTLSEDRMTRTGAALGTAPYMAPEQAAGRRDCVEARTDVYALGVVLYECLTGATPFHDESLWEVLRKVQFEEPLAPRRRRKDVPIELERVCLKAMAKRREDRYATAQALAEDLARYLEGRPVAAQTMRVWNRRFRWRHVALTALVAAALTPLVVLALRQFRAPVHLETGKGRADTPPPDLLPIPLPQTSFRTLEAKGEVYDLAFNPDGVHLAAATQSGGVMIWDVPAGRLVRTLPHPNSVYTIAFSPDGRRLASGGWDGALRVWDTATWAPTWEPQVLPEPSHGVWSVAFHPDGKLLAAGSSDHCVRLWDVERGECVRTIHTPYRPTSSVSIERDFLAAAGPGVTLVMVWDVRTGAEVATLARHSAEVTAVAFSPRGDLIASTGADGELRLWQRSSWSLRRTLRGHLKAGRALAWHPDGRILASGGEDGLTSLWDVDRREGPHVGWLREHAGTVGALAFSPDGTWLATGGHDGTVRLWSLEDARALVERLRDGNEHIDENNRIVERLVALKGLSVGPLLEAMRTRDFAGRGYAGFALAMVLRAVEEPEDRALEALVEALGDTDGYVRVLAASGVKLLRSPKTVLALIRHFDTGILEEFPGQRFETKEKALAWWEKHKGEYPPQVGAGE